MLRCKPRGDHLGVPIRSDLAALGLILDDGIADHRDHIHLTVVTLPVIVLVRHVLSAALHGVNLLIVVRLISEVGAAVAEPVTVAELVRVLLVIFLLFIDLFES